jgi:hypothetical protein
LDISENKINHFLRINVNWVIEGGYADLIELVISKATNIIFLNCDIETCRSNCKNRAWEPHKYKSLQEQNNNLDMQIEWVKDYPNRSDEFSLQKHLSLYNSFDGMKIEYKSNNREL